MVWPPKSRTGKTVCLVLAGIAAIVLAGLIWRAFSDKGLYKQELEELGFACETTSFAREARVARILRDEQTFAEIIAASSIAENELLNCNRSEEGYSFRVAAGGDAKILLGLAAEYYVCLPARTSEINSDEVAANLNLTRRSLSGHFAAVGRYVYGFEEIGQRAAFTSFLEAEGIGYAEYGSAGFACRA